MFQYSHIEDIDDDDFNIPILKIQMMFQYLHTVDADDGDLMIVQYSHTEDVDDDGLDDDVLMKPLSRVKFEHFRDKLGVVQRDLPRKGEQ